jgi:hypothetical protein
MTIIYCENGNCQFCIGELCGKDKIFIRDSGEIDEEKVICLDYLDKREEQ